MPLGEKTKLLWANIEYREKMRTAHLGKIPWNKGIKTEPNPEHSKRMTGRKVPETTGEKHHNWKGDEVSKTALHDYIKYYFPKPKICTDCKKEKKLDLANISQEYKRDLSDWEWLCRRCHMIKDGRLEKFNKLKK